MVKGGSFHKVVYRHEPTSTELFQVIVNEDEFKKWKAGDTTIPLADVVDSFNIFHSDQGTQGILGRPSKQQLDNVFGTHVDTDVVEQILHKGELQAATAKDGYSTTNDGKAGHNQKSLGSNQGR